MRRLLVLLSILWIITGSIANAAPLEQVCSGVAITSPRESGDPVRGRVNISGSASIPNFQFYKVEFAAGTNPADTSFHNMAADVHRSPVASGQLDVWDTTGLPDGPYTLRLTVIDMSGNFPCPPVYVRSVVVANRTLSATATPLITPTAVITATLAPEATATRPAAPTIELPTVSARPTLTSTSILSDTTPSRSLINLDLLTAAAQAASWGVCGMLGVIAVSGVYVVVRWIFDRL